MLLNQVLFIAGFFITPAVEKTKTQGKNSTSRRHPLKIEKLKKMTQFLDKNFGGTPTNAIFVNKYLQIRIFLNMCVKIV